MMDNERDEQQFAVDELRHFKIRDIPVQIQHSTSKSTITRECAVEKCHLIPPAMFLVAAYSIVTRIFGGLILIPRRRVYPIHVDSKAQVWLALVPILQHLIDVMNSRVLQVLPNVHLAILAKERVANAAGKNLYPSLSVVLYQDGSTDYRTLVNIVLKAPGILSSSFGQNSDGTAKLTRHDYSIISQAEGYCEPYAVPYSIIHDAVTTQVVDFLPYYEDGNPRLTVLTDDTPEESFFSVFVETVALSLQNCHLVEGGRIVDTFQFLDNSHFRRW